MILWWVFLGFCILCVSLYDGCVNGPKRRAQAQWDRDHYTGWRLDQGSDALHGLFFDNLNKETCTTKRYPGYPDCPSQQHYLNGKPQ
jgi:hypothetical protein